MMHTSRSDRRTTIIRHQALFWNRPLMLLLLALATVSASGCGGGADAHDDHHLAHLVPDHKPANFAQAVDEIRERTEHLKSHAGHGHAEEADEFQEVIDILKWLPELAADSDLSEPDWIQAATTSETLAGELMALKKTDGTLSLQEIDTKVAPHLEILQPLVARAGTPEPAIHHDHDHDHEHEEAAKVGE